MGRQVVLYDPDARGIGILDIDKLAYALGVVFCRPPLGKLDLAPRPMHVDADEEIDGAVAAVLVIVTFELTRLGRDRLALRRNKIDRPSGQEGSLLSVLTAQKCEVLAS